MHDAWQKYTTEAAAMDVRSGALYRTVLYVAIAIMIFGIAESAQPLPDSTVQKVHAEPSDAARNGNAVSADESR
jgi:hypothetical protein